MKLLINQPKIRIFVFIKTQCQIQHGEHCWLYQPLTEAYRKVFVDGRSKKPRSPQFEGVQFYSFEIWDCSSNLIAGEIGERSEE